MQYIWLIMLSVGAVVGLFFGAPRIFIGNVVFEPRRRTELIIWLLNGIVALALYGLHKLHILEMQWVPFLAGLFGARAIIILFGNHAIDKGLLPAKLLRMFYILRLWHQHPYLPCITTDFVRKTLRQDEQYFDGLDYAGICARLSWIAYQDRAAMEQCAEEWGLSCNRVAKDNLALIMLYDSKSIFVAFTGTNDLKDWMVNLDARPQKTEWGNVHTGFNQAANLIWTDLEKMVQETGIENPTIWLTGHSLGGALALITAVKLALWKFGTPAGIITFGQPAVGDSTFCSACVQNLGSRIFRVVNCSDEVPNQPPGYAHAGSLLYFDRRGRLHDQPKKLFMWADKMFQETRGPTEEHSMVQYLRLIESFVLYRVGSIENLDQGLWEAWERRVK